MAAAYTDSMLVINSPMPLVLCSFIIMQSHPICSILYYRLVVVVAASYLYCTTSQSKIM